MSSLITGFVAKEVAGGALAFMIFVLIYTPGLATLAQQWHTIGGRWTSIALVAQLTLAWALAVSVFQAVSLL